jgi:hypothetical protein
MSLRLLACATAVAVECGLGGAAIGRAQPSAQPSPEMTLAKGLRSRVRYSDRVDLGKGRVASVELSYWVLMDPSQEITIPAHGFYVAEVVGGAVATVANDKKETMHPPGDIWSVPDGQTVVVRFAGKKQQNAILRVFAVRFEGVK